MKVCWTLCLKMPEEFVTAYLGKEMNDTTWFDYVKGVENARKKARHIAQLYWIPKGNVPKWVDGPENTFSMKGFSIEDFRFHR